MSNPTPVDSIAIAVLTISDTRTHKTDKSGKLLCDRLQDVGHHLIEKAIVPDNIYQIRAVISGWIASDQIQAVVTTGGTGITGRDGTPEAITPLLDKTIAGFGELFRMLSYEDIETSALHSRAIAGVANQTYIFCLPGSSGACATGWDKIIRPQLDRQLRPCNLAQLMPRLEE